ncbi:hypothetical protein K1719_002370 [Acacia pycnantha]|nr:hypothetical protein K1719_002370 [Acacia pycnantha]
MVSTCVLLQVYCLAHQPFHLCHLKFGIVRFSLLMTSGLVRLPPLSSNKKLRTTIVHLGGPCPLGGVLQHPYVHSCSTVLSSICVKLLEVPGGYEPSYVPRQLFTALFSSYFQIHTFSIYFQNQ